MADIFIGATIDKYGTWQGPAAGRDQRFFNTPDAPPDPRYNGSIRMRRMDHDLSQWIPQDSGRLSRAQAHGPAAWSTSSDQIVWAEVWMRLNSLARWEQDDFHMAWEVHTPSANPGGIVALNLRSTAAGPEVSFRQWVGPGEWDHAYRGRRVIRLGDWHQYVIGYRPSTGNTGYYKAKFDGQVVHEQKGYRSTTQAGTHYEEIGFYTYWGAQGTDDMNIVTRVTTTEPTFPGSTPPPPPTPDPTPDPDPTPTPRPDITQAQLQQVREAITMARNVNETAAKRWTVLKPSHKGRLTSVVKRLDQALDVLD